MNISIYGAGYVGLVTAACFAKMGHCVVCADVNELRVSELNKGECPIHEQDLPELLIEQRKEGRLIFTLDIPWAIKQSAIHIIATGTPSLPDGGADLSQVYNVATQIAQEAENDAVVVIKSTVPVGTGAAIEKHIQQTLIQLKKNTCKLSVMSNPEFLREGSAVNDFMLADRIVLGGEGGAVSLMQEIYWPLVAKGIPLICMSRESAELTKYAANAMLACRISFINQISQMAEKVGANIDEIKHGIGTDHRIGPYFLNAGIGYGGACFPKDIRALIDAGNKLGIDTSLLKGIETINRTQKLWCVNQLKKHFNNQLQDKVIGIWGIAFKPGTDDIREASSIVIIQELLKAGVTLRVYDPIAQLDMNNTLNSDSIILCKTAGEVLSTRLDALVIATEWDEFKEYPMNLLAETLAGAPVFDGRNCLSLNHVDENKLFYYSVGRGCHAPGSFKK